MRPFSLLQHFLSSPAIYAVCINRRKDKRKIAFKKYIIQNKLLHKTVCKSRRGNETFARERNENWIIPLRNHKLLHRFWRNVSEASSYNSTAITSIQRVKEMIILMTIQTSRGKVVGHLYVIITFQKHNGRKSKRPTRKEKVTNQLNWIKFSEKKLDLIS